MKLLQVIRGDGEGNGIANRFVKPVISTVAEEKRQVPVCAHVLVVAFLVMNCGEIVRVDVDTHFYAKVLVAINIPGACVAVNVTITRANELGAFIERGWQSLQAQGNIEGVSIRRQ